MNRNNKNMEKIYLKKIKQGKTIWRYKKYLKNIVKLFLGRHFLDWYFVVYEVPSFPGDIYKWLDESPLCDSYEVLVRNQDQSIEKKKKLHSQSFFEMYERLIFVVHKV